MRHQNTRNRCGLKLILLTKLVALYLEIPVHEFPSVRCVVQSQQAMA